MKTIRADEYCKFVTDGTHDSPKQVDKGRKLITSKHLGRYGIDFEGAKNISESDYQKVISRSKVEQWDILFSMIGTIGNLYLERNHKIEYACKNMGIFQLGGDESKAKWLYYYLQTPKAKEYIETSGRGTTQSYVPLSALRALPVDVVDDFTRDKIIEILWDIDEKILTNQQVNENLEQQAQEIFKSWFIDNPENNDWKRGTFSELVVSTLNGDWGKEVPSGNNTEKVYCVRGADIPDIKAGNKGKMPIRYILPKNNAIKHLSDGDIVVEISGGSPTQSTGRCTAITQSLLDRYDSGMVCTNFCKAIKSLKGYNMFIYYYWQYLYNRKVFFSYENGTTGIKNLDFSGFLESEPIIIPPIDIVHKFNNFCRTIFDQVFANGKQTEQLVTIRDVLLPKLVFGEIDVSALKI